jgi:hypothetical protein
MRSRRLKNGINRGPRVYRRFDDTFGLCPICHKTDGCANAGRSHRYYCKEHRKFWCVGSNLFSSWRDQTEAEQRRIWNEIGLDDFEEVVPYFHPRFREDDVDTVIPFSADELPF